MIHCRNEEGLTLIELIIVLAVVAIIGGILAPNFIGTTEKARLRSDIQSAKIIQSAMELYEAENGKAVNGTSVEAIAKALTDSGYLNKGSWETQAADAEWALDGKTVKVKITGSDLKKISGQLTKQEQAYIVE